MRTITVNFTTDSSGNATETRTGLHGEVLSVGLITDLGDSAALANTVDVTVTDDSGGAGVTIASWTNASVATAASKRYPKVVPTQADGTALTTAGPAVSPTVQGRIKVAVAQGGITKNGRVLITLAN